MPNEIPYNILIGPLNSPGFIGSYIDSPQIKTFMSEPCDTDKYDITYCFPNANWDSVLSQLPTGWEPDIILWIDALRYASILPGIEKSPYPTALVIGDWNINSLNTLQYAQAFDYVFSDSRFVSLLNAVGYTSCTYWPTISFDPSLATIQPSPEKRFDITFIGSDDYYLRPERGAYIKRLASLSRDYRVFIGEANFNEYIDILRQSKIVFNHSWCHTLNPRVYEATICGALLFMEEENVDIHQLFPPGEGCVLYRDDNLEELLRYYLQHEDERQAIASRGHQIIHCFSYEKQFEWLLRLLPQAIAAFKGPERRHFNQLPPIEQRMVIAKQLSTAGTFQAEEAATRYLTANNALFAPAGELEHVSLIWCTILGNHFIERFYRLVEAGEAAQHLSQQSCYFYQQALQLAPNQAMIHYNLGWAYQLAGDHHSALKHYDLCRDLLQTDPHALDMPLQLDHFLITPYGRHYGPQQSYFFSCWQRLAADKTIAPAELQAAHRRLLLWQTCKAIGELWDGDYHIAKGEVKEQDKTLPDEQRSYYISRIRSAYEQALAAYPSLVDMDFKLALLSLEEQNFTLTLHHLQQALAKQPVIFNVFEIVARLPVVLFDLTEVLKLIETCLAIIQAYPKKEVLRRQLERQKSLVKVGLGWGDDLAILRQQIPLTFDPIWLEGLTQLFEHQLIPYHPALDLLLTPLTLTWQPQLPEALPHLPAMAQVQVQRGSLNAGDRGTTENTPDFILQVTSEIAPLTFKRSYEKLCEESLLSRGTEPCQWVGPEQIPFQFYSVTDFSLDLEKESPFNFLILAPQFNTPHLSEILSTFSQCFSHSTEVGALLWNPLRGPNPLELAHLETLLENDSLASITLLSDVMSDGLSQAALLEQVDVVVVEPTSWGNFYLWWSLFLGKPVLFSTPPVMPCSTIRPEQLALFLASDWKKSLCQAHENYPLYQKSATEVQQQLISFYAQHNEQKILDFLWQIRLRLGDL